MTNEKPDQNELTPIAASIRTLKELKENIGSEELSNEDIIERIETAIAALNAFGTADHLNSYSKKP